MIGSLSHSIGSVFQPIFHAFGWLLASRLLKPLRVITAAALVMSISFAALTAAHVSFMRMFGLGLTLAVLVDATLVRMVLVPAFMHLLGTRNWWAPKPLVWLHERFGLSDDQPDRTSERTHAPDQHPS